MKRRTNKKKVVEPVMQAPAFMFDEDERQEADHLLQQLDQVAHDISMSWGYGRLEQLTDYALLEKFNRQRKKFHDAYAIGLMPPIREHQAAMIRAWQKLDSEAAKNGHKKQDPHFMECQMDDGSIVVITNCDEGRRQALADGRNVFVYEAAEAAKILRKMYGQETIRQVFKEFPGAKIKNVKIKGDLNDDIPF